MADEDLVRFSITIPRMVREEIRQLAKAESRTMVNMTAVLLQRAVVREVRARLRAEARKGEL